MALKTFGGLGRRVGICWLPDGSGLISRFNLTLIQTIPSPIIPCNPVIIERTLLPQDSTFTGMVNDDDGDADDQLQCLVEILKTIPTTTFTLLDCNSLKGLRGWLLRRLKEKFKSSSPITNNDDCLWSIWKGEYFKAEELLKAAGLERLIVMATLRMEHNPLETFSDALNFLAKIQLELLPMTFQPLAIERLVLSLLSPESKEAFKGLESKIPWEGFLLAIMNFCNFKCLSQIVDTIMTLNFPNNFDPEWSVILFHVKGDPSLLPNFLHPKDGADWSRPYLLALSLGINDNPKLAKVMKVLRVQISGQLLAIGSWHLSAILGGCSIGPFVRLEREFQNNNPSSSLEQLFQFQHKIRMVNFHLGQTVTSLALANRCSYLGLPLEGINYLKRAGHYLEAQDLIRPLLVQALINRDDLKVKSFLEDIPKEALTDLAFISISYTSSSRFKNSNSITIEMSELVKKVSKLKPKDIYERVAFSELATRLVILNPNYCSPLLLSHISPEQCSNILCHISSNS